MGTPPVDGGRHRQHQPDLGQPPSVVFTSDLPAGFDGSETGRLTVTIPVQRPAIDEPTVAIRHVVMPPPAYRPYGEGIFDDVPGADVDAVYERATAEEISRGRWGLVLGAAVVTASAAYIVIAGFGGLHDTATTSALVTPSAAVTFSASAVPPAAPAEATSAAAPTRTVAPLAVAAPPTTAAVAPPAAAVAPVVVESLVPETSAPDAPPRVATPPPGRVPRPAPPAPGTPATGPTATPEPGPPTSSVSASAGPSASSVAPTT